MVTQATTDLSQLRVYGSDRGRGPIQYVKLSRKHLLISYLVFSMTLLNRTLLNRTLLNRALLNRTLLNRTLLNRALLSRALLGKTLLDRLLSFADSKAIRHLVLISFPLLVVLVFELYSPTLFILELSPKLESCALANVLTISYFLMMLFGLTPRQRLMALVFVPFSLAGEYVFSILFDLYSYRLDHIPVYVPFGHAILFSVGTLICELRIVRQYEEQLRPFFIWLSVTLLTLVVTLFHDTLSAVFALVFLWVLRRKGYNTLYFIMGLLVIYIELLGTSWGCWTWKPQPIDAFSWLHAANPPIGAFVCYVLGDIGVIKMTRFLGKKLLEEEQSEKELSKRELSERELSERESLESTGQEAIA